MSLFGGAAATPAAGGSSSLFGSNTGTSNSSSAGTLFGGGGNTGASRPSLSMNTNTSNSSAGTLFGGPASSTPTTTNSTSLFGKPAQTTSSAGSLFGSSTSTPPATTGGGGGLFGSSTTTPANNTSSLFGGASNTNASNTTTNNSTMPGMASMFGGLGAPASTPAPSTSTNLFGSTTPAPASASGASIFGSSTTAAPASGASLFGQPKPATTTPSLFGNPQPTTASNPFNQPNAFNAQSQQPQTQASPFAKPMFSSSTTYQPQQTQRSLFSTSIGQTLGLGSGSQTTTIPGVRIDVSNIKPTTRFADLYEGLQKEIESVDAFITSQISFNEACERIMPKIEERLSTVPTDVSYCETQLDNVQRALESDAGAIEDAKRSVRTDAEDASLSFDAIHNLKLPPQFQRVRQQASENTTGENESNERERDLSTYFGAQISEMGAKLAGLKGTLGQIENYLSSMEHRQLSALSNGRVSAPKSAEEKIREMAGVLREFEGGILNVAMKVGTVRDEVSSAVMRENGLRRW